MYECKLTFEAVLSSKMSDKFILSFNVTTLVNRMKLGMLKSVANNLSFFKI